MEGSALVAAHASTTASASCTAPAPPSALKYTREKETSLSIASAFKEVPTKPCGVPVLEREKNKQTT